MANLPAFIKEQPGCVLLAIKAQPRAPRNEIGTIAGDELKIRITAPPVDAAANEALLEFIAESVGCKRNQIELLRGGTSRHKVVRISGVSSTAVAERLSTPSNC